tara:strand:- start:35 stop:277 length:243 start_codon:yes stop_codon:yes gene_type:complete
MTWEDIIKEEDDKEFRLYVDNLANDMSNFLKDLNAFTKDANDEYKGADGGNTPSKAVMEQLSNMLGEMKKLLKQKYDKKV